MIITLVVCTDANNGIGKDGKLPWYYPEELEHFKDLTNGGTVVMGRTTYESIGKPLKGRRNIVLTSNPDSINSKEVITYLSINEFLRHEDMDDKEIFVIGGQSVYSQFLHLADAICVSIIMKEHESDASFPILNPNEWETNMSYDIIPGEISFYQLFRIWEETHNLQ